jgi:hypothetical protein
MQHINQYMAERNQLMAAQLFQQQVEVVAERDKTIAELQERLAQYEPAPAGEIEAIENFDAAGPDNG